MLKKTNLEFPKPKVKEALSNMLKDNDVEKHGELTEQDNGFTFKYSQFGTTTVSLTLNEVDSNNTEINLNFNIAPTHKIVLTEDNIDRNIDKYSLELKNKYL